VGLKGSHVSLVIPRLHINGADGLGNSLGLVCLPGLVLLDTLCLDPLGLLVILIIRAEKIDLLVILSSLGRGSATSPMKVDESTNNGVSIC
jgi:hypothetical protein